MVRLTRFSITGFRSYQNLQTLDIDDTITVIAGRNNVGKTALLRALRLPVESVPGLLNGFQAKYTWTASRDEWCRTIGTLQTVLGRWSDFGRFESLNLEATYQSWEDRVDLSAVPAESGFQLSWQWQGDVGPIDIRFADTPLHARAYIVGNNLAVALWWDRLGQISSEDQSLLLGEVASFISRRLYASFYVQPRRVGAQPQPFSVTEDLASDGANLSTVVATLYNNARRSTFEQLERFICSTFPDVQHIDVRMGGGPPTAFISLVYGTTGSELTVPLEHCGTGIEQMFMMATAILTAKEPKLFLIDEPHAFLHPAAERHLLRLMQDHPEHQYIVATHSPVFLNSLPLRSARLITISGAGSQINSVQEAAEILESVGITAADLWSADNLLWVEGPSDVAMINRLIAIHDGLSANSCRIASMPNWIRSASSSASRAEEMVKFCKSVQETIVPAKVRCLFLFDGDEKRQDLREQIKIATAGQARFLPVRELENLLLIPAAILATLSAICETLDLKPPSIEQITEDLDEALNDTKNRMLYKVNVSGPDRNHVVGSEDLSQLWRKWALVEYDKVAYGPDLLEQVYRLEPTFLNPLVGILMDAQALPSQQE